MGRYNHSLTLDATIMVSKNCPIIGDDVGIIFVTNHTVAMVTYCVTKMIPMCLPMIAQFLDAMIVASSDKEWL